MAYLDLAELETVFARRWFWSAQRAAAVRFDRRDHFGDERLALDACVRDLVEQHTGERPQGPIRLLTQLRYLGYCFNPLSLYYCYDASATRVRAVVAEVTNTPWKERHGYVLPGPTCLHARSWRVVQDKRMHVSPFLPPDMQYHWLLSLPGDRLRVHIANVREGQTVFDATLALQRRPLDTVNLMRAWLRHPAPTWKTTAAIHWQALRLWALGIPIHARSAGWNEPAPRALQTRSEPHLPALEERQQGMTVDAEEETNE